MESMQISQFFDNYVLRDSVIEQCQFSPQSQTLSFQLNLCNFMQRFYRNSDPDVAPGRLMFTGVADLKVDPDTTILNLEPPADCEIIEAGLDHDHQSKVVPSIKMVFQMTNYRTREQKVFVIRFRASDVKWEPSTVPVH
jgi:hypothetical protein